MTKTCGMKEPGPLSLLRAEGGASLFPLMSPKPTDMKLLMWIEKDECVGRDSEPEGNDHVKMVEPKTQVTITAVKKCEGS